jgi:hypothetical protein
MRHVPDFCWLLEREGNPCYPTARLFRQKSPGDWEGLIARVTAAIPAFLVNNQ